MAMRSELLGTIAVIIAAGAFTAGTVKRDFFAPASRSVNDVPPPRFVSNWREFLDDGILIGSPAAPVQILVLSDFECPFCARMETAINELRPRLGADLATIFVHHPLQGHRFAEPAARVAECALAQNRFEAMRDLLFGKQDSLGLKSWEDFARDARIPDLSKFRECNSQRQSIARVEAGLKLGQSLSIRGTPTILINGWLYYGLQPRDLEKEVAKRRTG